MPEALKISSLEPGNIIEFDNITDIEPFEDMLANEIVPFMLGRQLDAWAGRIAIKNLIRPPKFNGRIGDISLEVMDEPFERLHDVRDRGLQYMRGAGKYSKLEENKFRDELIAKYRGYKFRAVASSTGRGKIGEINSEIWYFPVSLKQAEITHTPRHDDSLHSGSAVARVLTKPKLEKDNFNKVHADSKRIGFDVERKGKLYPLTSGMRD